MAKRHGQSTFETPRGRQRGAQKAASLTRKKKTLAAKQNGQPQQSSEQQQPQCEQPQQREQQHQPACESDLSEDEKGEQQALLEIKSANRASICSVKANFNLI